LRGKIFRSSISGATRGDFPLFPNPRAGTKAAPIRSPTGDNVMRHRSTDKPWTSSEDAALIEQLGHGRSVEAIAAALQRSPAEIRDRLDALADAAGGAQPDPPIAIFPKDIAAS
jgi:hypothetical protein